MQRQESFKKQLGPFGTQMQGWPFCALKESAFSSEIITTHLADGVAFCGEVSCAFCGSGLLFAFLSSGILTPGISLEGGGATMRHSYQYEPTEWLQACGR
jgi:hypothetical protein